MNELPNNKECPNCGYQPFDSSFCPVCGQRKLLEKDRYISSLLKEFFSDFLQFENAFFKTIRGFVLSPSKYAREYVLGARKKYISPLKFFLLANAFYFLFPIINTFTTSFSIQETGLIYSKLTIGLIESAVENSGYSYTQFSNIYNPLTATLSKVLLIFLPFGFGLVTWLLSFKSKAKKTLVTHLNYSLILNAFMVLIIASILPGIYILVADYITGSTVILNDIQITLTSFLLMNIYGYFLYRNFFGSKLWISITRSLLLNISFFFLLMGYRFLLLIVTLGVILLQS